MVACVPGDTDAAGDAFARKTPQSPELYRSSVADSLALCGADSAPKRWLAASPLSQCALRSHVLCACAVLCVCVCVCVCVRACVRAWLGSWQPTARHRGRFGITQAVAGAVACGGSSPVPVDMRQRAQCRCSCGKGAPSPGADVAGVRPVLVQMWSGPCRCVLRVCRDDQKRPALDGHAVCMTGGPWDFVLWCCDSARLAWSHSGTTH